MPLQLLEKVGEDVDLARTQWGKALIQRHYKNPKTGVIDEFSIFDWKEGKVSPSIFMAVTADTKSVIAVRQFRHAANEIILELPGGCPKGDQTAEDVVRAELREETGYKAGAIIDLAPQKPIWVDAPSLTVPMRPFLVLDCTKAGEQQLDDEENIEVEIIALAEWIAMCLDGRVCCSKSITITFLSLPHLGITF